ncbi:7TM diverse intracellular signaling domain-containing protein [Salicola sp. Rm-C-2C1-2]|uniref:sensor domain-containing diguanylate cyclase n=1 Tax=Salicola sp. Rm-C-2C1-2 TaxID=3141321 RepID=UPI0032E50489
MSGWQSAVLLLLLMVVAVPLSAATLLPDDHDRQLAGTTEVLEDPGQRLTLAEVRRSEAWESHSEATFNKGYDDSAWWIRWSLANDSTHARRRILSIDYPLLQDLRLHISSDRETGWKLVRMGAQRLFSERPYEHRRFAVPVSWQPGETRHFYLRVQTDTALQVPLTLWDPPSFQAHSTLRTTVDGIYFGALIAIGLYNLLLFMAVRDRNYILYVGVVFAIAILVATINGYTFRYLWPTAPDWNLQSLIVFFGLALSFAALFISSFLEMRRHSRWLNAILLGEAVVGGLMVLASATLSYYSAIIIAIPLAVFATVYGFIVGVVAWVRGQRTAPYYLLAWSFLLLGMLILALSKGGVLPANIVTDSAAQVGSFLEILLLSFALAQRINIERRLRFEAQEAMLEESERHNRELEERVQARTEELEQANQRLNQLSVTDVLTGLKNRRYLADALPREIARAERDNRALSVAMIDIDHFKALNDTFGHKAGDACLQILGGILTDEVRAPDIAVRYGGEEFLLVFVDADRDGALGAVERLRARLARTRVPCNESELSFTVSAGVSIRKPDSFATANEMIQQADRALYKAKAEGRNRVCVHDASQEIRPGSPLG